MSSDDQYGWSDGTVHDHPEPGRIQHEVTVAGSQHRSFVSGLPKPKRSVLDVAAEAAFGVWAKRVKTEHMDLSWEEMPAEARAVWSEVAEAVADAIDEVGSLGDCGCAGSVTGALREAPWRGVFGG